MAKQRKTNTAVSALDSLLSTIVTVASVELKDNPEALAKVSKMAGDVKDSNFTTAMENLDDSIELQHELAEQAEQDDDNPEMAEEQDLTLEDTL